MSFVARSEFSAENPARTQSPEPLAVIVGATVQNEQLTRKMNIETHNINDRKIAEIITDEIILKTTEDGLDLLGNLYYQGFDKIIIHEKNIICDFFDLKTKIAGDILQKFTQYQMPLTIVGDFSKFNSKSLNDFIYESNKGKQINFVTSQSEALKVMSDQ